MKRITKNKTKKGSSKLRIKANKEFKDSKRKIKQDDPLKMRNKNTYRCPFCQKTSQDKGNLKVHLRKHTGIKPFKCRFCPQQFAALGNRRDHERRHNKERPYQCEVCNKQFYRKYVKTQHLLRQHIESDKFWNNSGKPIELFKIIKTFNDRIPSEQIESNLSASTQIKMVDMNTLDYANNNIEAANKDNTKCDLYITQERYCIDSSCNADRTSNSNKELQSLQPHDHQSDKDGLFQSETLMEFNSRQPQVFNSVERVFESSNNRIILNPKFSYQIIEISKHYSGIRRDFSQEIYQIKQLFIKNSDPSLTKVKSKQTLNMDQKNLKISDLLFQRLIENENHIDYE